MEGNVEGGLVSLIEDKSLEWKYVKESKGWVEVVVGVGVGVVVVVAVVVVVGSLFEAEDADDFELVVGAREGEVGLKVFFSPSKPKADSASSISKI